MQIIVRFFWISFGKGRQKKKTRLSEERYVFDTTRNLLYLFFVSFSKKENVMSEATATENDVKVSFSKKENGLYESKKVCNFTIYEAKAMYNTVLSST